MVFLIILSVILISVLSVAIHGFIVGYRQATTEPIQAKINELNDTAAHLETLIQRDYEIGILLEKELKSATGKQRRTLLNQLTTLDNRTLKNTKKLHQINDIIKELE